MDIIIVLLVIHVQFAKEE